MKGLLLTIITGVLFLCSPVHAENDNYGLTHGAIAGAATLATAYIYPPATPYVGAIACGWFIYRETQGPGNLFHSTGSSSDADRIMDWVVPCSVAGGLSYWEYKHGIFYPHMDGEGIGVTYEYRY